MKCQKKKNKLFRSNEMNVESQCETEKRSTIETKLNKIILRFLGKVGNRKETRTINKTVCVFPIEYEFEIKRERHRQKYTICLLLTNM